MPAQPFISFVERAYSAKFGLHASNMKFNEQNEESICIISPVYISIHMCNKNVLVIRGKIW